MEKTTFGVNEQTPRQIVAELDKYIVGQDEAKKSVAIALRNRWRSRQLTDTMQEDVIPKNILMIGSTGVGKTEIARRLAKLVKAPFVKVEATKFTEVGYVGRDVETIVRDLAEAAVHMVRQQRMNDVQEKAAELAEERIVDAFVPQPKQSQNPLGRLFGGSDDEEPQGEEEPKKYQAKSLKECIAIAEELNKGPIIEEEGFVVVDKDYHRIKVKSPKYVEAHKLKSGISKRVLIETITEPDFDAERYLLQFPEQEELILFYMDQINRLKEHVSHYAAYARDLYEQSGNSRKEVALQIKDDKFSGVGFAAIKDLEKTDEDLFRDLTEKFVLDNVEDFEFA